jgi:hypothetical protein
VRASERREREEGKIKVREGEESLKGGVYIKCVDAE